MYGSRWLASRLHGQSRMGLLPRDAGRPSLGESNAGAASPHKLNTPRQNVCWRHVCPAMARNRAQRLATEMQTPQAPSRAKPTKSKYAGGMSRCANSTHPPECLGPLSPQRRRGSIVEVRLVEGIDRRPVTLRDLARHRAVQHRHSPEAREVGAESASAYGCVGSAAARHLVRSLLVAGLVVIVTGVQGRHEEAERHSTTKFATHARVGQDHRALRHGLVGRRLQKRCEIRVRRRPA